MENIKLKTTTQSKQTSNPQVTKQKLRKKKKNSKIKQANIFLASLVTVLLLAVIGGFYYNYTINKKMSEVVNIDTIYNNIYINNIDIRGTTIEEAKNILNNTLLQPLHNKKLVFIYENKNWEISYSELQAGYNINDIVNQAYNIGRTGSLKERYDIVTELQEKPINLSLEYNFNKTILEDFIKKIALEINVEMKNSEFKRENGAFTGTTEQIGKTLDTQDAIDRAVACISEQREETIELAVENILPKYTKEYYNKMNNVIGTFSTIVSNPSPGGVANIKLASSKINDLLLYPGEVFSSLHCLGPITSVSGYIEAPIFVDGKLDNGIGGGVCQVSTTLYNAVMFAELEIVARQNHSRPVTYVDKGRDATLAGDYIDFKFKNTTEYPIYIESYVEGNILFVNIYGDEIHSPGRTLKFESSVVEIIKPPAEKIVEDSTLPAGTRVVVSSAKTGEKVYVYKSIYENGNLLNRTHISTSTYRATQAEVKVGTKKAN